MLEILETLKESDLPKSFIKDTQVFTDYIWNEAPNLVLPTGDNINGPMFASLVETYVASIGRGELPCMENAFTVMAKRETEKVISKVLEVFNHNIAKSGKVPTQTEEELSQLLEEGQKTAVDVFVTRAIFDKDGKFKTIFLEKLNEACSKIQEDNRSDSRKRCEDVLQEVGQTIKVRHSNGFYMKAGGYLLYTKDLRLLEDKYQQKSNLGVLKRQILADFNQKEAEPGNMILKADEKISEEEKQKEETKKTLALKESQMKAQGEQMRQLQANSERQLQLAAETAKQMENRMKQDRAVLEGKLAQAEQRRADEARRSAAESKRMGEATEQLHQKDMQLMKSQCEIQRLNGRSWLGRLFNF